MKIIIDQLHSKNLVPFKKRRGAYDIPGLTRHQAQESMEHVDKDLSPEEQIFIRHYLGYADMFLKSVPEQDFSEQRQEEDLAAQGKIEARPQGVEAQPKIDAVRNAPALSGTPEQPPSDEQSNRVGKAA